MEKSLPQSTQDSYSYSELCQCLGHPSSSEGGFESGSKGKVNHPWLFFVADSAKVSLKTLCAESSSTPAFYGVTNFRQSYYTTSQSFVEAISYTYDQ